MPEMKNVYAAKTDDLTVYCIVTCKNKNISKEVVGSSKDIWKAILGHKYHSDQSASYLANEANICNKSELDYSS